MCDCRQVINDKLKERNARLAFGFTFDAHSGMKLSPALIQLEKVETRKRGALPILVASFCPFCGGKYPDSEKAA